MAGQQIPNMPPTTALPLDRPLSLGGLTVHSHWLGGDDTQPGDFDFDGNRYGFGFKNWDFYKDHGDASPYYPAERYLAGPDTGTDVRSFVTTLKGWNFFSPFGLDFSTGRSHWPQGFPLGQSPRVVLPTHGTTFNGGDYQLPALQHYVLGAITGTAPFDGYAPLWQSSDDSISAIANYAKWSTILIVIDGTGSFGGGSPASGHIHDLFAQMHTDGMGDCRVIATKFSDYPDRYSWITDPNEIPAHLLGTWTSCNTTTADELIAASDAFDTGNGGDTNESQFEAIQLGLLTAENLGWNTARRCVLVYTDAASVVLYASGSDSAVRLNQRNDGLGITGSPRIAGGPNAATSVQGKGAPRLAQTPNTYQ